MNGAIDRSSIAFALRLADLAGEIVRARFRQTFSVDTKADASPVTEVDRAVEQACRELIARERAQDGVIGEEFGTHNPQASHQWIIDPIDGTRAFMAGRATFGTLVALARDGVPVLGVIDQPVTRDRWVGARGHATQFNGAVARVRTCASLNTAVLGTTSPEMFGATQLGSWLRLQTATAARIYGGDCTIYGALASGWLDLVLESGLKVYDFAALVPVIEGAGGALRDWRGAPLNTASSGDVLGCGDLRLLDQALRQIA
jgi:inositol-phosphate phosphatase/L-galactose 1-phosphate phosphatase/histidinol-phosphatase